MTKEIVKEHKQFENEEQLMTYLLLLDKDEKTITFIKKRITKYGFDSVKDLSFRDTFYKSAKESVIIYCFKCKKDYKVTPDHFLSFKGTRCKDCANRNRASFKKDIGEKRFNTEKSNLEIKLCLDLSNFIYISMKTHGWAVCLLCGKKFKITPDDLLNKIGKGCSICVKKQQGKNKNEKVRREFIKRARKVHGNKYDYSKVIYIDIYTEVIIICPIHGEFKITPNSHLNSGAGCKLCVNLKSIEQLMIDLNNRDTLKEFLYFKNIIARTYKNNTSTIWIYCKKCGKFFPQIVNGHLQGNGCPKCKASKGNKCIYEYLDKLPFYYESEYYLTKGSNPLRLDALVTINGKKIGIEYDGRQHFEPTNFGGKMTEEQMLENLKKQTERDERKNKLCEEQNIILIRIPYKGLLQLKDIRKNVYDTLDKELSKYLRLKD